MNRLIRRATVLGFALSFAFAVNARAQTVMAPVETLDFDRPESWALKYFGSTMLLSGLGTAEAVQPGSVQVGFEFSWLPALSPAQENVGFDGTKQEDLNKAPVFARPRVTIGLPRRFALIVAFNPPITTFGVTPRIFAAGLEHPMLARAGWTAGWRVYGQTGTATGAYTCPASVLNFAPGSANNSYGCQALSTDVATFRNIGGEFDAAHRMERLHGLTPHLAVAVTYMNNTFHVDALTFDYLDRTLLKTSGVTLAMSGGVGYPLTHRLNAVVDVFYSPLSVQRSVNAATTIDGLLNVRALLTYRVH